MDTSVKALWLGVSLCVFGMAVQSHSASAAGFALREQSVEGQGASFAGVAAGTNGLSSMFWNPATMSLHNEQGLITENNTSIILPYSRAKNGTGFPGSRDSGDIAETGIIPASYSVYGLTDDLTIGLAIGAPFGLATNADAWAGSFHGDESEAMTLNVNPNVAYQLNDMISVAVGIQGQYMNVKLTSDSPLGAEIFRAEADDIAFGFTAGVLFQPSESTSIGLGFRSSINHKLEGESQFAAIGFDGDVSASFKTPEIVTLGLRQEITEDISLLAGVEWANWSRFKSLDIIRDDNGQVLATTPEEWNDSWFYSVGAEYAVNDRLLVRSGFAYENSGVPDSTRTPRVPDNDRYWLSAGASYKVTDWITANVAYSYVFVEDGNVNLTSPPSDLNATFEQHIHILAAGATLDW